MKLRHLAPALLAAAALGCSQSVPSNPNTFIVTAQFDPTAAILPLPNSLVLDPRLNPTVLFPRNAQEELLATFYRAGGFPPDQVTPVSFPIAALTVNGPNDVASAAPELDMTSIVPCTGQQAPGGCNLIVIDALAPAAQQFPSLAVQYTKGSTNGTLSVTPVQNGAPVNWRPGATYFYALRGATTQGIRSAANVPLQPSPTTYLLLFGQPSDFTCPPTNPDCSLKSLQDLQLAYQPVFATIQNKGFPLSETVVVGTFTVAPATTWVVADPGNTAAPLPVPLPSDFLIDPTTGHITTAFDAQIPGASTLDGFSTTAMILAPTSGTIDASTVHAPTADGAGVFLYEVGASGATKVPDVVDALLSGGSVQPVYAAQPPPIQFSGLSPVIGLQPAVPVSGTGYAYMLPPLKENTEYAVVVTNRVKDALGRPLSNTTLGQIELFTHPLCTPSPACASSPSTAVSQLPGIPGAQAAGLEAMRLALKPVIAQLGADTGCAATPVGAGCVTQDMVTMAYTFRTQTISGKNATAAFGGKGAIGAIQLAAVPYTPLLQLACGALQQQLGLASLDCTKPLPGTLQAYSVGGAAGQTVADAFTAWGVDLSVPHDKIDSIYVLQIMTPNKIDDNTGALDPSPTGVHPEVLTVLVAVGAQARVPACTGPLAPFAAAGIHCAPLVLFQHGITTAKNYMLSVANTLVDAGNVVVAIDLPWHGQRSYCSTTAVPGNPDAACAPGNHCVPVPALAGQGLLSAPTPGLCRTGTTPDSPLGAFLNRAALCLDPGTIGVQGSSCAPAPGLPNPIALNPATGAPTNAGFPFTSGQFFLSSNFFRTRDTFRQTWIDHTQVMQVLAPTPTPGPIADNDFYNSLLAKGIVVNPLDISFVGQSLGSFFATGSMAANPRVSRGVLNTNGATAVDVFTNSPTYQPQADALLSQLGIDMALVRNPPAPGSPTYPAYLQAAAQYLLYVNALKLIIDPADPINLGTHVATDTWPNLLPPLGGNPDGSVSQAPKMSLAQYAICDQSVPNPFNALIAGNMGLTPFLPPVGPGTGTVQWFGTPLVTYPAFPPAYPSACSIGVPHEFLIDWGFEYAPGSATRAAVRALTQAAQSSAASWLASPTTLPPSLVVAP
jgi:hypothetical protein